MSDDLKIKTLRGLFWSFLERSGQQGIQLLLSIILARMLFPEQFGLIAMLMIFMAIAQMIVDGGFGQALIQKKNITHVDECSIFYFNIFLSFIVVGLLYLSAPWIAAFYGEQLLIPMTRALSLNLIFNAFGLMQSSLLIKRIDFKTQYRVSIISTALSGAVGITMAYNEFGVWSLVAQSLSANLFRTTALWVFIDWRPSLVFSLSALREMFGFGSRILASGLISAVFQNIYLLVIGKVYVAAETGYYSRANLFQQAPVLIVSDIVSRVMFPIFSSIQDDKERLKRGMRKALSILAMVSFPMMVGLAVIAKPLVITLLTVKWLPIVPYLQLLCIRGALYPLQVINIIVLKAQGRADLNLKITILKNVLKVVFLLFTWNKGIQAIILGQISASLLSYLVNSYYTALLIKYPAWEQIRDISPYAIVALIMGTGIYAIEYFISMSDALLLSFQLVVGFVLFIGLSYIFRVRALKETWSLYKQYLNNG